MKKRRLIPIILLGFLIFQSCATSTPYLEGVPKNRVVKVDGKTKNQLYIRSNTWMVESFNNAESVIQFKDKEDGIVIGKYLLSSKGYPDKKVYAVIKIQVKEGAARITVTPDGIRLPPNSFDEKNYYSVENLIIDIDELFANFEKSIVKTESTDW